VMSTGMRPRIATMRIQMRRNKHLKPMMDQRRMWRTEGIVGDVDGYVCEDGDDVDVDVEEQASQADDGSTQNVEDCQHSTRECEDSTVYFRPLKYDNVEANATASDVSEAKSQSLPYMGRVRHPIYSNSGEVKCGYRQKKDINIARRCVNGYRITVAPAKSVTHVSF